VDERDAAQIGGGGEARHVADDAATERNQRGRAVGIRANERVVDARDGRQLLEALAVGHEDRLGDVDRACDVRSVQPPDERARDHETPFGRAEFVEENREALDRARGNRHGVGTRRRGDVDANRIHLRRALLNAW
jgi:hypothetical protein